MGIRSLCVVWCVAITVPAVVHADPGETAYQEGRKHYDLREWDQAIERFKESYRLRSDAKSLFNIAQAYRLKGDCVNASAFYKTYKRNFPKEKNIAIVEKFITDLEACASQPVKTEPVKTEPVKTEPVKTEPVKTEPIKSDGVSEPPASEHDTGGGKRTLGLVLGSAGLLAIGAGTYFGLDARSKANAVSQGGDTGMPPEYDPAVEKAGLDSQRNARILWGVGGAALATGVVLYLVGRPSERTAVTVMPHTDGALVVWSGAL